jgi:hypothetical protein
MRENSNFKMFNWTEYINKTETRKKDKNKVMSSKELNYPFYIRSLNDNVNIDNLSKAYDHYNEIGNPLYDAKINLMISLDINPDKYEYFYYLDDFMTSYYPQSDIQSTYNLIIHNPKIEYRYFCYRYLNYIRQYTIPSLSIGNIKEAVLIEFRIFLHLEFLIRNAIHKLGNSWSFTIILWTSK